MRSRADGGAGVDAVLSNDLTRAIRDVVAQASSGALARIDLDTLAATLGQSGKMGWRNVQYLENHDLVWIDNASDRAPRLPRLADPSDPTSWYARSRSRVATALLLTAPALPLRDASVQWDRLTTDRSRQDFLRFVRELLAMRRDLPAIRRGEINVFHVHNDNRVLAFHRWIESEGGDVVVVISLRETAHFGYGLGFPGSGRWRERFNSDVYDLWVNPTVQGNGESITAYGPPLHAFPCSAQIVIPANGFVLFTR